jgi:uncharacterized protein
MNPSRYALITGASSGIGECFARSLAGRGNNLILVARSVDKLKILAQELTTGHAIKADVIPCDLSAEGAGNSLAAVVRERGLEVDLLVNNAGFGARGAICKLPLGRQLDMIRLHDTAMVELTHHFVPPMVKRREGAVINVSSMTSFQPMPYFAVYAATKAFMTSFSMGLAEELRPHGVAVVTLCPGGTRTNFVVEGDVKDRRKFPGGPQPAEEVVADALRALDQGGGLVVPRWSNKLSVFVQRFMPRGFVVKMVTRMTKPADL